MTWIATIAPSEAEGRLRSLYERVKAPDGTVDEILMAHSLRPHTLEGHMALYKNVLHHSGNSLPQWFLEVIGIHVSLLNGCSYCVEHHYAGLQRLLQDKARATALRRALEAGSLTDAFSERETALLTYAQRLTEAPADLKGSDLERLRDVGLTDGEILETNQVASYFAYANRTVLGLGVAVEGDTLGLSPGDFDDPLNWSHA